MRLKICRRETFNAAHRLNNPKWDEQTNLEVFGKCNSPNYHGHNYVLETYVSGEPDPETGYLMDLKVLKEIIRGEVCERFDHKNLNLDTEEFKNLNPTAENIVMVCYRLLREKIDPKLGLYLRLYETQKNWVEYGEE
ncbi:6-carboxytetrahydropterin synthase [Lishizhenia sp.]|uniref:6-pyruvoyl trahydropterin synthase family protein n=1 Tax=Lishizhenia sp. TaxID=2497594 RepID=UPI00299ECADB|nr:6-carboxytetrahydropterin synthase [Lishizhenia sp.]MDX1446293.1 6-carboxytetrahydropterin synthase [Lishizhenia sp.]